MKDILMRLIDHEPFSREDTHKIMIGITEQAYNDQQLSALLMGLQMRGVSVDELLGFMDGLLETGRRVDLSEYSPLDIVGTGGDGKNTFNISTCSCFVVAGAGYKVCKHGNVGATSVSGASDVMQMHGVVFTNDMSKLHRSIEETNFVYLHAPLFANGMKFVAPTRKNMQVPTCFNLLGPLVNPARPAYQMLGVATLAQMRLYSNIYQKTGVKYCIVNSIDGYDEISLTGDFKVTSRHYERVFRPDDIGMRRLSPDELSGGSTREEVARLFDEVLAGTSPEGPRNVVIANAAFAINLIEPELSLQECMAKAAESIDSGCAYDTLKKFISLNS